MIAWEMVYNLLVHCVYRVVLFPLSVSQGSRGVHILLITWMKKWSILFKFAGNTKLKSIVNSTENIIKIQNEKMATLRE